MHFNEITPQGYHGKLEYITASPDKKISLQADDLVQDALSFAKQFSYGIDFSTIDWRKLNMSESTKEQKIDALKLLLTAESISHVVEQDLFYPIFTQHPIKENQERISVMEHYTKKLTAAGLETSLLFEHSIETRARFSAENQSPAVLILALKKLLALRFPDRQMDQFLEFSEVKLPDTFETTVYSTPFIESLDLRIELNGNRIKSGDKKMTTKHGMYSLELTAVDTDGTYSRTLSDEFKSDELEVVSKDFLFDETSFKPEDRPDNPEIFNRDIVLTHQTTDEFVTAFISEHSDFTDNTPEDVDQTQSRKMRLTYPSGMNQLDFTWIDNDHTIRVIETRTDLYFKRQSEVILKQLSNDLPDKLLERLIDLHQTERQRYPNPESSKSIPIVLVGKISWNLINEATRSILPMPEKMKSWMKENSVNLASLGSKSEVFESDFFVADTHVRVGWQVVFETSEPSESNSQNSLEPHVYCWNAALE